MPPSSSTVMFDLFDVQYHRAAEEYKKSTNLTAWASPITSISNTSYIWLVNKWYLKYLFIMKLTLQTDYALRILIVLGK